jgi:excisionase family DNA binding protein
MLDVSTLTIYRRIQSGELAALRVGESGHGPLRIPADAVERLLHPTRGSNER